MIPTKKIAYILVFCFSSSQIQAGWLPEWISNQFSFKTYVGLGALALTGTSLAGYIWYKKFSPWSDYNKKLQITLLTESDFENFKSWEAACDQLTKMVHENVNQKYNKKLHSTALTYVEFNRVLNSYIDLIKKNDDFKNTTKWVNQELPTQLFASLAPNQQPTFDPHVQKLVVAPESVISFHGDLHGDIHSLNAYLKTLADKGYLDRNDPFKIVDDNFYMVFLGDYTDRGWYGAEVIYTILRLKCENSDKVFLVRGNHEDSDINLAYGFHNELQNKFKGNNMSQVFTKIKKMYETLPLALYLGSGTEEHKDFLLCCHGGIEIGFNPLPLLNVQNNLAFTKLGELKRHDNFYKLSTDKDMLQHCLQESELESECCNYTPIALIEDSYDGFLSLLIGFQWNDYEVDPEKPNIYPSNGRGWVIGKDFNNALLGINSDKHTKVRGVFRAHQHSPDPETAMMKRILNSDGLDHEHNVGVGRLWIDKAPIDPQKLWDNIVCTFNVCPHTPYQQAGFKYDTYGLLTVAEDYDNWRLEVVKQAQFE
jgi:hypothetical protein